ncbi:MAG: prephenate dehydrogenase/arogenate dehydrogenase family protein [Vicinamibacterales bacterium]|nr:prephenate dehydrogenase/arogenate dehydrogenase family protein [Vicinamibacterales bacterium]
MSDTPTPRHLPMLQARDLAPAPVFEKIAVVGLGLIGGSIALAAREVWPRGLLIAVDRKDVLEQAMVRHAIDVAADDLGVIAEADLVILAAPVRQNIALLSELDACVPGAAVVTDVSSTKQDVVEAARALPARFTFVGGHPLAGAARGGFEHARPDLFKGRPWIFTPHTDAGGEALDRLRQFATGLGAVPASMEAAAHDRLVAFLSHLPQLTASALMAVVGEAVGVEGLALSGRGLVDTTRLASSPADIWRDIAWTNAADIRQALTALIGRLSHLRDELEEGGAIDETFEEAARWREALMQDRTH